MALKRDPVTTRRFVVDALRLAGATFTEVDEDLVIATCEVTRPGGIYMEPRVAREDLQLVFTAEGAGRYPSAELVCPGSYRLQWFIAGIRARGFLTKAYYADDLGTRRVEKEITALMPRSAPRFSFRSQRRAFVPYLLAVLKLTRTADTKWEELLPLALNLVDGGFRPGLPERLRQAAFVPELDYQRVERRHLPWRTVWRMLEAKAMERVESYGQDWYAAALSRLSTEGEQLRQFYRESAAEAEDPEATRAEYQRRLAELSDKYSPVIKVALANMALLYLPVIVYTVEDADGRPLPPLRYEPAAGEIFWEAIKNNYEL